MARIQLENVKKKFGKVTALDGVTIDVKDNEFFVLFGPAGAGKTTMLNCIAGITLPEEGLIKFDGEIMNLVDRVSKGEDMEKCKCPKCKCSIAKTLTEEVRMERMSYV